MDNSEKLLLEQFDSLPRNLRDAIKAISWKKVLSIIVAKKSLDRDKSEALERETLFILYGLETPQDYPANLMRELALSESEINEIIETIDEQIFEPVFNKAEELAKLNSQTAIVQEIEPTNLPMIEKGEVVHDVPHVEQSITPPTPIISAPTPTPTPAPQPVPLKAAPVNPTIHYQGGKDPYREPLE